MRNTLVLILFVCIAMSSFAQPTFQTWETQTIKSLRTGEEKAFNCQFIIYPDDRIEWIQGTVVKTFAITSTQGSLSAQGPGSITYILMKEGRSGKIIVERDSSGQTILVLDLADGSNIGAYFSFKISNP